MVAGYIYLHVGVFVCLVFVFMIRSDFSNRILLEPCSWKVFMLQGVDSVHFFFFSLFKAPERPHRSRPSHHCLVCPGGLPGKAVVPTALLPRAVALARISLCKRGGGWPLSGVGAGGHTVEDAPSIEAGFGGCCGAGADTVPLPSPEHSKGNMVKPHTGGLPGGGGPRKPAEGGGAFRPPLSASRPLSRPSGGCGTGHRV